MGSGETNRFSREKEAEEDTLISLPHGEEEEEEPQPCLDDLASRRRNNRGVSTGIPSAPIAESAGQRFRAPGFRSLFALFCPAFPMLAAESPAHDDRGVQGTSCVCTFNLGAVNHVCVFLFFATS